MSLSMNEKLRALAHAAVSAATGRPLSGSGTKYFASGKKGETYELKADLNSDSASTKKEALKRIIANMTVGKDVSHLFADVIKCMASPDLSVKKLVYLYLMHYATAQPQLALLAINTFCRDTEDPNPTVRALALRTMACIRMEKMIEYLCDPLSRCLKDPHPYVRKTAALAVAKLNELSPVIVAEHDFQERLISLLQDSSPTVIANAVMALLEIRQFNAKNNGVSEDNRALDNLPLNKLLSALNDCTEWGQLSLLQALALVTPTSEFEAESIIDKVLPRLQHTNPAVVLAALKVLLVHLKHLGSSNPEFAEGVRRRFVPPLISLVSHPLEQVQFSVLRSVYLLLLEDPELLAPVLPVFFCKYTDPLYVKVEKLRILVLLSSTGNGDVLLEELKGYCKEVDMVFVDQVIASMGHMAAKIPPLASRIVALLLSQIETGVPHLVQSALVVLARDLWRGEPTIRALLQPHLPKLLSTAVLHVTRDPYPKAALLFLFGEAPHLLEDPVGWLAHFCDSFGQETLPVQYATLTAAIKVHLALPSPAVQALLAKFLQRAVENPLLDNMDLRDRLVSYWRLVASSPDTALVVLAEPGKQVVAPTRGVSTEQLKRLLVDLNHLSSVYHVPPEQLPSAPKPRLISSTTEGSPSAGPGPSSTAMLDFLDWDDGHLINHSGSPTAGAMSMGASVPSAAPTATAPGTTATPATSLPKGNALIDLLGDDFAF